MGSIHPQEREAYAFSLADCRAIVADSIFPDTFTFSVPFCSTAVLLPRQRALQMTSFPEELSLGIRTIPSSLGVWGFQE